MWGGVSRAICPSASEIKWRGASQRGEQRMTIVEAIQEVLRDAAEPRTIDQIYCEIVSRNSYSFKAVDPKSVVRSQLRRHCLGLDFPLQAP